MPTVNVRLRGRRHVHGDRVIPAIGRCRGDNIPDYAVSALAEFLGDIVAFVYDEVLVEDLEDLAPMEVCHCARVRGWSCCCKRGRVSPDGPF